MYGVEPNFWLVLIIVVVTMMVTNATFNAVMSRKLKVEKKKTFSYNHVNGRHKKVDKRLRISFLVLIIIGLYYNVMAMPTEISWYTQPVTTLFLFIFVSESMRAYFEWKYATNRNDYIYTISQLVFNIILVSVVFTGFFIWLV